MKSLLYWIAVIIGFFVVKRGAGFGVALLFLLAVIAAKIYTNRASLLTKIATQIYFNKEDPQKAAKLFEKAYKTGEMPTKCKIAYSAFCLRENKIQKGKKLLTEIINSRFSTADDKNGAKHNMAILLWREGNLTEAIEMLEALHKKAPATNTYASLGVLYIERAMESGEYENELDFMREAYEYNDSDKTICDNLGELYYMMGEYEKAEEVYEKLMKLNFFTPVPYYNYGRVLKALGKNEQAKEVFEKALTIRFTSVMTITREDVKKEIEELNL